MKRSMIWCFLLVLIFASTPVFAAGKQDVDSMDATESITFSVMASGTYDKAAEEVAATFKQETGIEVKVAAFPWATLRQNNTTDLLTESGQYDVMSGSYYLAELYEHFLPLDDLIKKYNFGSGLLDGFMEKSEHFDGHQIGLPYGPDAYGMVYRKDLMDKAGITWPNTWTEFVAILPQLKDLASKNGMDALVFAGGAPEQAPALFFDKFDGYFINSAGKYELESKKAVEVLLLNKKINESIMAKDYMGLSIDDANARFLDGKALIMFGWPSFVTAACQDPDKSKVVDKWALGKAFTQGRPWLSLWQMYISKYSKSPDASFKWVMALINEKNDYNFLKKYGIGPVFKSTYNNKEMLAANVSYLEAQAKNLSMAFNPPLSGESQDYFASVLGEFSLGKLTAAEVVKKVNEKWATLAVPPALLEAAQITGQTAK